MRFRRNYGIYLGPWGKGLDYGQLEGEKGLVFNVARGEVVVCLFLDIGSGFLFSRNKSVLAAS